MKRLNKFFLALGSSFLLFVFAFSPFFAKAYDTFSINRNLKLGDSGEDVLLLQKALNRDAWTRIATVGPGSPGNETRFFGLKTKEAVARFQERYASEVLAPAGLTRGTGFVGALTRNKIQSLSVTLTVPSQAPASSFVMVTTTANPLETLAPIASYGAANNRNLINLDQFLEGLARVQVKNNASESQATQVTAQVRTDALTKGDFLEEVSSREKAAIERKQQQSNKSWRDILIASFKKVNPFVNVAKAQGPAMGGPILYYYPCTCSATTLIFVGPPSPVEYVEYVYGTQGFLSYNLPYATYMKGLYTPGSGSTCYIYIGTGCSNISSEGLIDTVVGSSPA